MRVWFLHLAPRPPWRTPSHVVWIRGRSRAGPRASKSVAAAWSIVVIVCVAVAANRRGVPDMSHDSVFVQQRRAEIPSELLHSDLVAQHVVDPRTGRELARRCSTMSGVPCVSTGRRTPRAPSTCSVAARPTAESAFQSTLMAATVKMYTATLRDGAKAHREETLRGQPPALEVSVGAEPWRAGSLQGDGLGQAVEPDLRGDAALWREGWLRGDGSGYVPGRSRSAKGCYKETCWGNALRSNSVLMST